MPMDTVFSLKGGWKMLQIKNTILRSRKIVTGSFLLICLLSLGSPRAFSQDRSKPETIEATAMGTGTQLGREFSVTLTIYEYSPRADKQILMDAFQNGKDQGLYNALSKMKVVGRIAVTGTIGYDVSYIQMTPTPTGRKIRFV